jgi:nucleotide-binding universal stress UspA family protein
VSTSEVSRTATVVVPLDGSLPALGALPVAKGLAEVAGGMVHIIHVAREPLPAAKQLERIGLTAADLHGSVLDIRTGDPATGILQAAREQQAVAIVMCIHAGATADAVGDTALKLLKNAPCPVVLVQPERPPLPWKLQRILLPHDGSPATSAAIRPAAELARKAGAELDVLHVTFPGARAAAEQGSLTPSRYLDQPHGWPAWGQEFLERLLSVSSLGAAKVRVRLAVGAPEVEVLRAAVEDSSDLILLAWHGVWDDTHAGIVKAAIRRAPCPVGIFRVNGST